VVRLAVHAPGAAIADGEPAVAEIRRAVETEFGGTLAVESDAGAGGGATLTMALPVPSHRFRDPALWWER